MRIKAYKNGEAVSSRMALQVIPIPFIKSPFRKGGPSMLEGDLSYFVIPAYEPESIFHYANKTTNNRQIRQNNLKPAPFSDRQV